MEWIKQNIVLLLFIFLAITVISVFSYKYFKTKYVHFEFVGSTDFPLIDKNYFDHSFYHFVTDRELLYVLMSKAEIDSTTINIIDKKLSYKKEDYIITYNKELLNLVYSPYLAFKKDACEYLDEKPLFPKYSEIRTNKIYIYKIKKDIGYRVPCP